MKPAVGPVERDREVDPIEEELRAVIRAGLDDSDSSEIDADLDRGDLRGDVVKLLSPVLLLASQLKHLPASFRVRQLQQRAVLVALDLRDLLSLRSELL